MDGFYTDISQSKKLIELGIDVGTADMVWQSIEDDESFDGTWEAIPRGGSLDVGYKDDIPAWSLNALLKIISVLNFTIKCENNEFNIDILERHCKIWFPSLTDAAFEMVYWLLENKKI